MSEILLGNIKGPKGEQGEQGPKGEKPVFRLEENGDLFVSYE